MSEDKISLIVSDNFGERLDVYLSLKLEKTRSYIKKLLDDGKITVNGKIVKCGYKIKADDKISAELREPEELNVKPAEIELDIVYEAEYLAAMP